MTCHLVDLPLELKEPRPTILTVEIVEEEEEDRSPVVEEEEEMVEAAVKVVEEVAELRSKLKYLML